MNYFKKIEKAIGQAVQIPEKDLGDWLTKYCADDHGLRSEIESLLQHRKASVNFLERSAGVYVAKLLHGQPDTIAGKRFGPYTILREIGKGGMGAVYLAERSDGEFDRKVAIKIISRTFSDVELEKHFRRERQILANLDHPNIAKLLDGGVSDAGEPFLVMEFVRGRTLVEHAAEHQFDTDARLRLFLKTCRAVSFSHQNLIVHRDIKPSNVLVEESGEPKLLDFGLAKVFDKTLDDPERTETSFRADRKSVV